VPIFLGFFFSLTALVFLQQPCHILAIASVMLSSLFFFSLSFGSGFLAVPHEEVFCSDSPLQ